MLRRPVRFLCACACLAATCAVPHASWAQVSAEEKATAESVFQEGMRLIKVGNFAAACPKFELSQRVEPGVGTMLYLAECYEKTNRTASSWAMFREAASLAETSGQTERMKTAQARAARLEPRLAWLTIAVATDALVPGLQIRRNAVTVSAELSGTATPVDPGEVVVEATAPGRLPFSTKVNVAANGRVVVAIPPLAEAPEAKPVAAAPVAAPMAAPAHAPPAAREGESPHAPVTPAAPALSAPAERASPLPWVVGGVGVLALGVGSYFGLKAMSNAREARDSCPKGLCNELHGATLASDARSAAKVSNVSFVVGAAALAAGAVLYLTRPTKHAPQVGLTPMLGPSSLGLAVGGWL